MSLTFDDLPGAIRSTRLRIKSQVPDLEGAFAAVHEAMRREVEEIQEVRARGGRVIPEIDFPAISRGDVSEDMVREVERRGVAIVRRVFPAEQVSV